MVTIFTTIFYESLIHLVLAFDFIFYKFIHPRRVTIIKCKEFIWKKIRKNVFYSFVKDRNYFVDSFAIK